MGAPRSSSPLPHTAAWCCQSGGAARGLMIARNTENKALYTTAISAQGVLAQRAGAAGGCLNERALWAAHLAQAGLRLCLLLRGGRRRCH